MAIKVTIRRKTDHRHADKIQALLCAFECWASKQTGYFYGENLEDTQRPGEYLFVSTWRSLEAFHQWHQSPTSRKLEQQMASTCGIETDSIVCA